MSDTGTVSHRPPPDYFSLFSWQSGPRLMLTLHRDTGDTAIDWTEVERTANDPDDQSRFMAKALLAVREGKATSADLN